MRLEEVVDAPGPDQPLGQGEQPGHVGAVAGVQAEPRGVGDRAVAVDEPGPGVGGVLDAEGADLLPHRDRRVVQGRDRLQEVPQAHVVLVLEHPAAPGDVTARARRGGGAVQRTARDRRLLQDPHVLAGHARVPDEEGGRGERGHAAADQMDLGALRCRHGLTSGFGNGRGAGGRSGTARCRPSPGRRGGRGGGARTGENVLARRTRVRRGEASRTGYEAGTVSWKAVPAER